MSRKKKFIPRKIHFDVVREVYLNRDGIKIGQVVRWRGRLAYVSWRTAEHYFIKYHGFGVDRALLNSMIKDDGIDFIIIQYSGVRGLRYFISGIDDWYNHAIDVAYTKDKVDTTQSNGIVYYDNPRVETYGMQKILSEDFMDELEVE